MANKLGDPVSLNNWNLGGISESSILGARNESLYKMIGTSIHDKVGLLTNNRRLVKESGSVVDGLVKTIVVCSDGNAYLFSSTSGKIWKRTSEKAYSLVYTVNSSVGSDSILGACEYGGYLYWATQNYLYRIQVSHAGSAWSSYVEEVGHLNTDPVCGDSGHLGGNEHVALLDTSISESVGKYVQFTPVLKTMSGFAIDISQLPTESLTFVLHDSNNTSIVSKTVSSEHLTTGINEIYWDAVVTYEMGEIYHLHIYKTGIGDALIKTAEESSLTNAYLIIFGESNSSYHPMIVVNDVLFIGDNNYVHQYENWLTLNALDIPQQHAIKTLGKMDIDLLIGTEVKNNVNSAMIYRWNTWSESWTIEDEIPEKGIHAFIPVDNFVYLVAGDRGNVYFYNGEQLQLFRRIGGEFNRTDKITVNPSATASLHGIPLIGVSNVSGNPMECGVYGMGTVNPQQFPRVFDLEYVLSKGLSNITIGAVAVHNDDVLVSWKSGEEYGVDSFDGDNLYSGAYIQTRVLYQDRNDRSVYRGARINYKEAFDNTPKVVTFTDKVNLTSHGLQENEPIIFSTTDTLPAGLTAGTIYYVREVATNTFKVSTTAGGTPLTIADAGVGVHSVRLANVIRLYYRADYETDWIELELVQDMDKHQFKTETFGESAFCIEFKLELRAWGSKGVVIDEVTFYPASTNV